MVGHVRVCRPNRTSIAGFQLLRCSLKYEAMCVCERQIMQYFCAADALEATIYGLKSLFFVLHHELLQSKFKMFGLCFVLCVRHRQLLGQGDIVVIFHKFATRRDRGFSALGSGDLRMHVCASHDRSEFLRFISLCARIANELKVEQNLAETHIILLWARYGFLYRQQNN